ncbi:class I SAM-dependent methyltransferase [Halomonas sp. PR-M31]|uniref:class I SAM-dependent methyltransferase n=1 Tax=Halomonas sp. PR-M31 TaxID=1471202 RepID=UPI0006510BA4|nr:class I SAM-dependent methyltransferase [Halomonas sp. PR-M31]
MTQPAPGSIFDTGWLSLRESADAAARDETLTHQAIEYLQQRKQPGRALSLIDLGSGGGSNLRFLAPRLPGPQSWRLIDHDADLLKEAIASATPLCDGSGESIDVQADCRSLADIEADWFSGCDLISASALFDLVSLDWLERLAAACAAQQTAVLFTMSVTGDWRFLDADGQIQEIPEDRWVRDQLIAHQQRDKGLGIALGSRAPQALVQAFARQGYQVKSAPSPWRLFPGQPDTQALGHSLIEGWAGAVHEQTPNKRQRLERWLVHRLSQLNAGALGLEVGHKDFFACPPAPGSKASDSTSDDQ